MESKTIATHEIETDIEEGLLSSPSPNEASHDVNSPFAGSPTNINANSFTQNADTAGVAVATLPSLAPRADGQELIHHDDVHSSQDWSWITSATMNTVHCQPTTITDDESAGTHAHGNDGERTVSVEELVKRISELAVNGSGQIDLRDLEALATKATVPRNDVAQTIGGDAASLPAGLSPSPIEREVSSLVAASVIKNDCVDSSAQITAAAVTATGIPDGKSVAAHAHGNDEMRNTKSPVFNESTQNIAGTSSQLSAGLGLKLVHDKAGPLPPTAILNSSSLVEEKMRRDDLHMEQTQYYSGPPLPPVMFGNTNVAKKISSSGQSADEATKENRSSTLLRPPVPFNAASVSDSIPDSSLVEEKMRRDDLHMEQTQYYSGKTISSSGQSAVEATKENRSSTLLSPPVPFTAASVSDSIPDSSLVEEKLRRDDLHMEQTQYYSGKKISSSGQSAVEATKENRSSTLLSPPVPFTAASVSDDDNVKKHHRGRDSILVPSREEMEMDSKPHATLTRPSDLRNRHEVSAQLNNTDLGAIVDPPIIERSGINGTPILEENKSEPLPLIPEAFLVEERDDEVFIGTPVAPVIPWWKRKRFVFSLVLFAAVVLAIAVGVSILMNKQAERDGSDDSSLD